MTSGSAAQCWGENRSGQIGNDSTFDVGLPTDVVGLSSGVVRIAAGGGHTCALTSSGSVKCWGENGSSLLGDGTATWRLTPVDVIGITGATAIAVEPFVFKTGFEFDERTSNPPRKFHQERSVEERCVVTVVDQPLVRCWR